MGSLGGKEAAGSWSLSSTPVGWARGRDGLPQVSRPQPALLGSSEAGCLILQSCPEAGQEDSFVCPSGLPQESGVTLARQLPSAEAVPHDGGRKAENPPSSWGIQPVSVKGGSGWCSLVSMTGGKRTVLSLWGTSGGDGRQGTMMSPCHPPAATEARGGCRIKC